MFLSEFCKKYKLDKEKLKPMIIILMKKYYPGLKTLSDFSIMQYTDVISLSDQFYIDLSKYVKLWAFS